jgi:subtilisin family serine protease
MRIGVRISKEVAGDPVDLASHAARLAGLVPALGGHEVVNDFVVLALDRASAKDEAQSSRVMDALAKGPGVLMASPVFHNAFVEGGYWMPTDRILVRAKDDLDAGALLARLAPELEVANARLGSMAGAMTLRTTSANGFEAMRAANRLAESGEFKWSHPAALETLQLAYVNPTDPAFGAQWVHRNLAQNNGGVIDMDMDTDWAWDIEDGVTSVEIFVIDTGVEPTHPDLNWAGGRDFSGGDVNGVGSGAPTGTCDDHGTAVAGCAAEMGNNIGGRGTAPGCEVVSGKIGVQQSNPCGTGFVSFSSEWLVNALDWGRDFGCEVSNASFGSTPNDAVQDMYTDTWNSGMVHVAAAGNGGGDSLGDDGSAFPGSATNVISISALDPDGTLTSFSNYGTNVDACTGGIGIYTTDRQGANGYTQTDYNTTFRGTSAASPLVAGVCALVMSEFPFATPSQVRSMVLNTCEDLGVPGDDAFYNNGFVNAYNALRAFAPSNDSCTSPIVVQGLNYSNTQSVTWATNALTEPNESCAGTVSRTVFYRYVAPNTGLLTVSTLGTTWDTVLSVYDGCPLLFDGQVIVNPTQLACNDDHNGTVQSRVTNLMLEHGDSVLIKVSAKGLQSGSMALDFNLAFQPIAPSNDVCSLATSITDPGTGGFTFEPALLDTDYATRPACEPQGNCASQFDNNSVWYRFEPTHSGVIHVDTFGSDYDTVLSIFNSCAFSQNGMCLLPPLLACNDDTIGNLAAITGFPVTGGETYLIKVADYGTEGGGLLDFNFEYVPTPPSNDSCGSAMVLPSTDVPFDAPPVDVFYATLGLCDNLTPCDGVAEHNSVWYRFTAPEDGTLDLDTFGSEFNTVLAVYPECGALTLNNGCVRHDALACNNDSGSTQSQIENLAVEGGEDYLIKVTGYSAVQSSASTLRLRIDFDGYCPADWNQDGGVDGDDVIEFFSGWDIGRGDFNGDGGTDGDDVIEFFGHWDNGC